MVKAVDRTGLSRPALLAALGTACISAAPVLITMAHVSPATAALYRCALPLPALGGLALAEQRRYGPRRAKDRVRTGLAGLLFALNLILWIHSITDVGAGAATVLGNLQVLFVLVFSWVIWRQRPQRRYLAAIPVVLIGVVMVSGMIGGRGTALDPVAGIGYGLGASATYACFLLALRRTAGSGTHVAGQLFDVMAGAAAGAFILGLTFGGLQLAVSWRSLACLLILSVASGIVGWLLLTWSLPRLSATLSSLILLLEPAAALLLATLILRQRPSLTQLIGAGLVCGGVMMAARRSVDQGDQ